MRNNKLKTEHAGAKKGRGAFWGRKVEAKCRSNSLRRQVGKIESRQINQEDNESFLVHEALDRTYIQILSLDSALSEHPTIKNDIECSKMLERALDELNDLYQHLGSMNANDA